MTATLSTWSSAPPPTDLFTPALAAALELPLSQLPPVPPLPSRDRLTYQLLKPRARSEPVYALALVRTYVDQRLATHTRRGTDQALYELERMHADHFPAFLGARWCYNLPPFAPLRPSKRTPASASTSTSTSTHTLSPAILSTAASVSSVSPRTSTLSASLDSAPNRYGSARTHVYLTPPNSPPQSLPSALRNPSYNQHHSHGQSESQSRSRPNQTHPQPQTQPRSHASHARSPPIPIPRQHPHLGHSASVTAGWAPHSPPATPNVPSARPTMPYGSPLLVGSMDGLGLIGLGLEQQHQTPARAQTQGQRLSQTQAQSLPQQQQHHDQRPRPRPRTRSRVRWDEALAVPLEPPPPYSVHDVASI